MQHCFIDREAAAAINRLISRTAVTIKVEQYCFAQKIGISVSISTVKFSFDAQFHFTAAVNSPWNFDFSSNVSKLIASVPLLLHITYSHAGGNYGFSSSSLLSRFHLCVLPRVLDGPGHVAWKSVTFPPKSPTCVNPDSLRWSAWIQLLPRSSKVHLSSTVLARWSARSHLRPRKWTQSENSNPRRRTKVRHRSINDSKKCA